jgi:hypothetical protein
MSRSCSRTLLVVLTAWLPVAPTNASAEQTSLDPSFAWLGEPRTISRAWSASRDTPAMNMIIAPRAANMAGGELALASLRFQTWSVRAGFSGFLELESDGRTNGVNSGPIPWGSGKILWRGSYAFYEAFALDSLARRLCTGCALEFTAQYRHESQHYTASNYGDSGEDVSAEPYVGDDLILDAALAKRVGHWYFAQRVAGMWFLPNRSSYSAGASADLYARWTHFTLVHPMVSLYAEYRAGDTLMGRAFPDAYRLRALLGVALPSGLGDIMVYGFGDVGHRYGIRGLTEEATLGFGIRLALGTQVSG